MTVKPMEPKEIKRLMSNFKPTPELDLLFGQAMVDGKLPTVSSMERLRKAGYVEKGGNGNYEITDEATKYSWEKLPEQAKIVQARVHKLEEEEREQREKERAKQQRISDQNFADVLVKQGLLVVKGGRYRNTPKGWEDALRWLQYEVGKALDGKHRDWLDYQDTTITARSGDFENVPISQPWRYHDNQLLIKRGFNRVRKRILESLTDDELELFGRPPKSDRLNKPAKEAKARLVEALTRCQEGATDLVIAKSKERR